MVNEHKCCDSDIRLCITVVVRRTSQFRCCYLHRFAYGLLTACVRRLMAS